MYRLSIVASTLLLGACTVTQQDCDPRNADASFATKFNCNTQGVYDQRVTHKQQVLLDEQKTNQMFRDVYAAIQKERSEVSSELGKNRSEYASLNKALNALLSDLKKRAQGNQRIQTQIAGIEKDMADVNRQDNTAVMQKQYELQKLQNRVADLESDLGLQK
ncbi:hypothetical protein [Azomonas macrocytogenes]|uniref:Chromosome segregation ATPase n=1 Tax=Azomonas macrocytogenes TaxID=69962 RepID=A0A839T3G8_AZOMA|nr:hypothetical protein [Azomonas macrocytogenes]MBB3103016.1 chromosome segregation ATPase [Azomonas macrocytogenes]